MGDSTYLSSISMSITYDPADATGLLTLNITINTSTSNPVEIAVDNPFEASVNLSLISVNNEQGGNVVVDYGADNITILFNNTSWVELSFTIDDLMESTAPGIYTTYLDLTGYNDVPNFSLTLQIPSGYVVEINPSLGASVEYGESVTIILTKPLLYTIVASTPISTTTATAPTTTPSATTMTSPSLITTSTTPMQPHNTSTGAGSSIQQVPVVAIAVILVIIIAVGYLLIKARR